MIRRFWCFFVGFLLLLTAGWLLWGGWSDGLETAPLDRLPDYDYVAEINKLMQQKRWGEAQILCEDVIALELPQAEQAQELSLICQAESKKIGNRLYKAGKGFITGSPDGSIEELGGSVVSDMFMYGDVRDLVKQGYFKLTGKETDPVIAGLAAVGLATEFVDWFDWVPAGLKAMRKVGAVTDALGKHITQMTKKIFSTKKIDQSSKVFFGNLKTMFDQAGFIRSTHMIKHAETPADIAVLAKSAEKSPQLTHLVARTADKRTCEMIQVASKQKNPDSFLKKLVRKGPDAIKLISRSGKIIYKGHLLALLKALLGGYLYLLCLILVGCGAFLIFRSAKSIKVIFPFKKKNIKA